LTQINAGVAAAQEHVAVARRARHVLVHDLGSTLGTIVNGRAIGRHFASDSAELRPGENRIIAGGWGSPFEFQVIAN
jgi:CRP/FNR family transcriptional regulator, cyclic AMP receptor protein